jgi:hypothetical protein
MRHCFIKVSASARLPSRGSTSSSLDDRVVQSVEHAGAVSVSGGDATAGQQQALTAIADFAPDKALRERHAAAVRGFDRHRLAAVGPPGDEGPPVAGRHHDDGCWLQPHGRKVAAAQGASPGEHIVERQVVGRRQVEAPAAAHVAYLEGGDPHVEARQQLFHR